MRRTKMKKSTLQKALESLRQPLVEGRGIKVFPLVEGTWSAPQSLSQARRLAALLDRGPLTASLALERLYDLMGDDELFDELENFDRRKPDGDVRWIVVKKLRQWINNRDNFTRPWDHEALTVLGKLVRQHSR